MLVAEVGVPRVNGFSWTTADPAYFDNFIEKDVAPVVDLSFVTIQKIIYYGQEQSEQGKF